ncbi:MAG TPA: gephyrin-like molybdotransferase Glp [Thermoanaerobaculia bacterium]|nr:gephyrin-like molybdotransferase Glp [Thermoanaerobaculia bacterium]
MTFQSRPATDLLLPVEEAQQRALDEVRILGIERVALTAAHGRVLREDVAAVRDVPQADNTAMDGYAVRSADIASSSIESPVVLEVIEDAPAGVVASRVVTSGTAIRIMTGALMPEGADVVVPVELTDAGSQRVAIRKPVRAGQNIRRQGEDMRAGEVVLRAGSPLGAAEIGVLATAQRPMISVGRQPMVAVLSTGDEIVDLGESPADGKVVNSNSYSLAALVREAGAIPRMLGIVPDTKEATIAAIRSALEADLIVSTGGVSVGAFDFVKDALDALGAETKFWQIAMKPGKPVVLSLLGDRLFFGLPGNPVSCMVSFLLFVAPAIRKSMGQKNNLLPPIVKANLERDLRSRGDRRAYQRVRLTTRDGELIAIPMATQGSGVSTSMLGANGFAIVEEGVTCIEAGRAVPVVVVGAIHSD